MLLRKLTVLKYPRTQALPSNPCSTSTASRGSDCPLKVMTLVFESVKKIVTVFVHFSPKKKKEIFFLRLCFSCVLDLGHHFMKLRVVWRPADKT